MRILVDAMGGDFAPGAPVRGALRANRERGIEVVLVGREEAIRAELDAAGVTALPPGVRVVNATEVVEICDDPATAFKKKKDSSLTVGLTLLRDGEGDGFVSAGSTGALLAGATLVVKRIRGVRRAALAPVMPTETGRAVLLDCGANAECTVEYLCQFAQLGSDYAKSMWQLAAPRVGLLNIGAEPSKGDTLRREAYEALTQLAGVNFVGNVEAKEAMLGACDVLVADGFAGNVMLKTIEGAGKLMGHKLKALFKTNLRTKLAYLLLKDEFAAFKKLLDPNEVGGTALLGISKPVVKAHGSSNEYAFFNAVVQAAAVAESGIIGEMTARLAAQNAACAGTDKMPIDSGN